MHFIYNHGCSSYLLSPVSNPPSVLLEAGRLRHFCDAFPLPILRTLNQTISSVHHSEPIFALLRPRGVLQQPGLDGVELLRSTKAILHSQEGYIGLWTIGLWTATATLSCFLDPACQFKRLVSESGVTPLNTDSTKAGLAREHNKPTTAVRP